MEFLTPYDAAYNSLARDIEVLQRIRAGLAEDEEALKALSRVMWRLNIELNELQEKRMQ